MDPRGAKSKRNRRLTIRTVYIHPMKLSSHSKNNEILFTKLKSLQSLLIRQRVLENADGTEFIFGDKLQPNKSSTSMDRPNEVPMVENSLHEAQKCRSLQLTRVRICYDHESQELKSNISCSLDCYFVHSILIVLLKLPNSVLECESLEGHLEIIQRSCKRDHEILGSKKRYLKIVGWHFANFTPIDYVTSLSSRKCKRATGSQGRGRGKFIQFQWNTYVTDVSHLLGHVGVRGGCRCCGEVEILALKIP